MEEEYSLLMKWNEKTNSYVVNLDIKNFHYTYVCNKADKKKAEDIYNALKVVLNGIKQNYDLVEKSK